MERDSIGNRMKEFYENRSKTYLTRRTPVIIRIDGCHFHSFCKGLKKPFDKIFIQTMQLTTKDLCENIQGCKLGYVESDEISLLLMDYDTFTTEAWFGYSIQKLCSVSASMAAMYFNRNFTKCVEKFGEKTMDVLNEDNPDFYYYKDVLLKKVMLGGYFDARCFNIPENEVTNYFIWRQNDASRNSIQGVAQANFSQKQLNGLNNSQLQDKLIFEKGINWNDYSAVEKRGSCVIRSYDEKIQRYKWILDTEIPVFTQNRNYIENILNVRLNQND